MNNPQLLYDLLTCMEYAAAEGNKVQLKQLNHQFSQILGRAYPRQLEGSIADSYDTAGNKFVNLVDTVANTSAEERLEELEEGRRIRLRIPMPGTHNVISESGHKQYLDDFLKSITSGKRRESAMRILLPRLIDSHQVAYGAGYEGLAGQYDESLESLVA